MEQKIPVVFKNSLMSKLWFIISKCFDREWSGTLFCEVHGNLGDADFKITAHDFFLQDIGSSGYTEYETDFTLIEYMEANPQLLEYQRHKIHSHNVMSCFHSGTDMSDIHDNIQYYNFLLSVVINNKTEFDAKIASVGTIASPAEVIKLKGNEGKLVTLKTDKVEKDALFLYNCNIIIETDVELVKRIDFLAKSRLEAEKKVKEAFAAKSNSSFKSHNDFYASKAFDSFTKTKTKDKFVYNSFEKSKLKEDSKTEINKSISQFLVKLIYMDLQTPLYDLQQALMKVSKELDGAGESAKLMYADYVDTNLYDMMMNYFEWDDIYLEQENKVLETMISLLNPYRGMSSAAEVLIDIFEDYHEENVDIETDALERDEELQTYIRQFD